MNYQPTPDHWIGRLIGDHQRYRLDKRLGGGGMGDVYVAMDTKLGQEVALKLLKDTLSGSGEMRKRFEREVAVSAALQSEHIVKVSDYGVTPEGYPFYVMEYLRGETLRQLLLREKRLSVERTVGIITQVCKGLQLAHEGVTPQQDGVRTSEQIQVIHRDLKPDNIFLVHISLGELVKILDFGIAKIRSESSEQTNLTSAFLGTVRYAAPEQLKGDNNLDGRADIYSLGIILYEMLSAADPFGFSIKARSMSQASWIFAHTNESPKPLRSQPGCEQLSKELEAVVMRCLQKEPVKRFASVEELNQALFSVAELARASAREETDVQLRLQTQGSHEETIAQPLPSRESKREETIAQPLPSRESKREETIAQPRKKLLLTRRLPFAISLTLGIIAIWLVGMGGIYAYRQFQISKVLDELRTLKAKENYEQCITKSKQDPSFYQEVQRILNECRMKYAMKLASENKLLEAIATAEKIPNNSPLYPEAQAHIKDWESL